MGFEITTRADRESKRPIANPQLVLEIDGVDTLFGAVTIYRIIRIGDPGLVIGNAWKIGGLSKTEDQVDNISFDGGTSTKINQQLQPDKGAVSSVSSVQVALTDENLVMSRLISPGLVVEDMLGRNCKLWMGFKNTAFKEDYTPVFQGIIDDIQSGPGIVIFDIAAPEQLKRQNIFTPITVLVTDTIEDSDDVVPLENADLVPRPIVGPDGSTIDTGLNFFIKLQDEIIKYTGVSGNNLTGCVRGQLATLPARHQINMTWTCLVQYTPDNYMLGTVPSGYFTFWNAGNTQKYYVWFSAVVLGVPISNNPSVSVAALADAIGIEVSLSSPSDITSAADIADRIAAGINSSTSGKLTAVASGASIKAACTDAGKASDPDPATSGFAFAVVDKGIDELQAQTLVQVSGNVIDVALKLMLSGTNDFYVKDLPVTQYLHPDAFTLVPNSIFFQDVDLNGDYGVVAGDFITITGATDPANDCVKKVIQEVVIVDRGSYLVVEDVSFVTEVGSAAVASIRSQYDVWEDGLAMDPSQVDILEHIYWRNLLLGSYSYRFVLQDQINGKDFLDKEVYLPIGAFSLPRQGRCSMGYTVGPSLRGTIKTIDRTNIKDPDKIKLRRSISRNFYNTVVYQMDENPADGSFINGQITQDADSATRIPVGNRVFSVASKGLRKALGGFGISSAVASRYLSRYRLGAEFFESIGVFFQAGYTFECGDIILFDASGLRVTNTVDGSRNRGAKLYQVINKSLDLKTGDCQLFLTDTNSDASERYGAISPSSKIVSGTTTRLKIKDSFGSIFPGNESKKWANYLGLPIIVHSPDWSFSETVTLKSIDPADRYTLILDPSTPLSVAPSADYVIDIDSYPDNTDATDEQAYKAVHAFLCATIAIVSGADTTHFDVDSGDVARFSVGSLVRVRNASFSDDSGFVKVLSIVGTTIEVDTDLGFTPDSTYVAEGMSFTDGGFAYRIF